jgi:hypothetical protein
VFPTISTGLKTEKILKIFPVLGPLKCGKHGRFFAPKDGAGMK